MLDKLSKRILKYMCTADDPSNTYYDFGGDLFRIADAVSSDAETVRAAVEYLHATGYIRYQGPVEKPYSFLLGHLGLHYRERVRRENAQFFRRNVLTPIFVSFVTSIITVNAWPAILRLLQTLW